MIDRGGRSPLEFLGCAIAMIAQPALRFVTLLPRLDQRPVRIRAEREPLFPPGEAVLRPPGTIALGGVIRYSPPESESL
jgi:hypothetical protein